MSQRVILTFVVIAVIVLGGGALFLVKNSVKKQPNAATGTQTTTSSDSTTPTPAPKSAAPVQTDSVVIQNHAFSPANITVKKGTTVTWTNKDNDPHTVTVDEDMSPESGVSAGPNSGNILFAKTYSYTFSGTGTFKYRCTIHPSMTGTVTVTE